MSFYKKLLIYSILALIASIYIFNTFLDFSRLFSFDLYNRFPNEVIKRINVLLAAALIWAAHKDGLDLKDNLLMKYTFLVIGAGESFFLLKRPDMGILSFAICQCILIARHSKNLGSILRNAPLKKRLLLGFWALALLTAYVSVITSLSSYIAFTAVILLGGIYGAVLSVSLWTGLACHILRLFAYPNSKMIAMGMLCFYCCDIMVGLDGLLGYGPAWILASSLIWVFYTPATALLALSCYKYVKKLYAIDL